MLSKGISYPGQNFDEQVLLFLRRHKFTFYWPWGVTITLMMLTWLVILIFFLVNLGGGLFPIQYNALLVVVLGAYFLIILMVFLTAWVSFYFDVVIVTKTHLLVIEQNGFFNRKVSEQSLLRIQDVSARMKGFWQTWLRFGTVFVETAGEAPNFEMSNLPKPHVVGNMILKLHDELVASGGYEAGEGEGEGVLRESPAHLRQQIVQKPVETISNQSEALLDTVEGKDFKKEEEKFVESQESEEKSVQDESANSGKIEKKQGELHDGDVIKF